MSAICLLVAGTLRAALPADEFTLRWRHSVEKTLIEERYRIQDDRLALINARVQGLGAGMVTGPDAVLKDGWWSWQPTVAPMSTVRLTRSAYTSDYDLCWNDRCATLTSLIAEDGDVAVDVRACQQ
jgi:hypothetical protein